MTTHYSPWEPSPARPHRRLATSTMMAAAVVTATLASAAIVHACAVRATVTLSGQGQLRNLLLSADGTLDTSVGVYNDCAGTTELTHSASAIDTCIAGATYFVGHNAGVFTPLMDMGVGSLITYYDGDGTAHLWRVVSARPDWLRADGIPAVTESDVVAQFQTCAVPDGTIDRILDVVQA